MDNFEVLFKKKKNNNFGKIFFNFFNKFFLFFHLFEDMQNGD